ncbi:DUF4199 domain-containing protein [Capnocytophaga sp. G1920]|uniref:DUF4199 domain-containing protein n=1 Tax=Capnocytophaga sp. G1920 TaxID=3448875 RepID=UPI003EDC6ABF
MFMETKNVNFLSIALRNGILLGVACVVLSVLLYVTNLLYTGSFLIGAITWLLNLAICVVFIVMAVHQYKTANDGFLTVGEAIKVGVVTALVGGVIAAIYSVIYTTVIDPNYYEKVVEVTMEKMSAFTSNFSEEQMEELREKTLQSKPSVVWTFFSSILGSAIGGVIISAIVGAVKKKERPMPL